MNKIKVSNSSLRIFSACCQRKRERWDDLFADESGGAGRFAFSIWRMLPPPARFRHRTSPMKSPSCRRDIDWFTVERWPSLISSQPRLRYTVNALRVLRYAHREWCRLTRVILHLAPLSLCPRKTTYCLCPLPYLFITSLYYERRIFFRKTT